MPLAVGLIALWLIGMIVAALAVRQAMRNPRQGRHRPAPLDMDTPHVAIGGNVLTKRLLYREPGLWVITRIAYGDFDPTPGPEIFITAAGGPSLLDPQGKLVRHVELDDGPDLVPVELDGDDACEFMNADLTPALYSHRGKLLWSFSDDLAQGFEAADVDHDGRPEFAVAAGVDETIRLLDHDLKELWRTHTDRAWRMHLVDLNHNGRYRIVQSDFAQELVVLDTQGNVLSRRIPEPAARPIFFSIYFSWFTVSPWPTRRDPVRVLTHADGAILVLDFEGKQLARLPLPKIGDDTDMQVTLVRFQANGPDYLAAACRLLDPDRTALFVLDQTGKIVYEEVFTESAEALAAMPVGPDGDEALLVGAKGALYQYLLTHPRS